MRARVVCTDCDGERERFGIPCAGCDGEGVVVIAPARDALVHDILGPRFGHRRSEEFLSTLNAHRAELAAWLLEVGVLRTTGFGLSFPPRNITGAYRRPSGDGPTVKRWDADSDARWRLYTVQT